MYYSMVETSTLFEYKLKKSASPIQNSISRSSHQKCSIKKVLLIFCNINGKTLMLESIF